MTSNRELSQEEITKLLNNKDQIAPERPPTDEELKLIQHNIHKRIKHDEESGNDWAVAEIEKFYKDIDETTFMVTSTKEQLSVSFKFKSNLETGFMMIALDEDSTKS